MRKMRRHSEESRLEHTFGFPHPCFNSDGYITDSYGITIGIEYLMKRGKDARNSIT